MLRRYIPQTVWLLLVVGFAILHLVTHYTTYKLLLVIGIEIPPVVGFELLNSMKEYLPLFFGFIFFFAMALPEELLYRLLPLGLCMASDKFRKYLPLVVVISSVGFGIGHGGLINMVAQGVSGFLLCGQFLVHRRIGNNRYSTMGVVATHALVNTSILYFF